MQEFILFRYGNPERLIDVFKNNFTERTIVMYGRICREVEDISDLTKNRSVSIITTEFIDLDHTPMQENLITALQDRWMSEKEAKVYLTVLELWSAPASTIARHAEEKRTTIYALLKKLTWDSIMQELKRKDISYFSVVSPELLLKHIESKTDWFKEIVPLMIELANTKWSKPKISYMEWSEWMRKLFEDFSSSTTDMRAILWTPKYFHEKFSDKIQVYRRSRKKKELKSLRIFCDQKTDKQYKKYLNDGDKEYNRETRLVRNLTYDITADINIYWPNKISFLFFDESWIPHILIIENKDMFQTLYSLFEIVWNWADKL